MDFSKIKPAVEEITLSDEQKEQIISSCQGKKRKFNYRPLIAAAAAAIIISVIFSPGFLFRAKTADSAENAAQGNLKNDYYYTADEEYYDAQASNSSAGGPMEDICIFADLTAFEAEEFTELYTLIPAEFLHLSGDEDLSTWLAGISANEGMAIMQFVIRFNVSREDFDHANISFAARTGKFFDADAVYSFDKELTDSIYRK